MKKSHNKRRRDPRGRHPHHRHHHHSHRNLDIRSAEDIIYIQDDLDNLSSLFEKYTDIDYCVRKIGNIGPDHKIIRGTLILGMLAKVFKHLDIIPSNTARDLISIWGEIPGHRREDFEYPIKLPNSIMDLVDENFTEEVLEEIGEGPEEGVILDLVILNALDILNNHFDAEKTSKSKTESDEK